MQGLGLIAALVTGLAGSLHCAGSCAGISFSLTVGLQSTDNPVRRFLAVQAGRMVAYAGAGAIVGGGGGALATLLGWSDANHWLRAGAAVVMVWTGLGIAGLVPSPHRLTGLVPLAVPAIRAAFVRPAAHGRLGFMTGLGWGMMPCGMVYLALMTATFTGGVLPGAAYMAAFFLGTLPVLTVTTLALARGAAAGRADASLRRPLGLAVVGLAFLTMLMPGGIGGLFCAG